MSEAERLLARLAELRAMQVALEHYRRLLQLLIRPIRKDLH